MPRKATNILLYGANGFTGALTAKLAAQDEAYTEFFKSRLILAGRSAEKVQAIANETGFPHRVFSIDAKDEEIDKHLADIRVVILMAGPFIYTTEPMLKACIRTKTDYLDITGEQDVLALIHEKYAAQIAQAGILAISGTGFDIVPTDVVASRLAEALPTATHLELAFGSKNMTPSGGTAFTTVEILGTGGSACARINGEMKQMPVNFKTRTVNFPTIGENHVAFFPWGDCYSAYFSTGIPNTLVYIPTPPLFAKITYWASPVVQFLVRHVPLLKTGIQYAIRKFVTGPTEEVQRSGTVDVWGEAYDERTGKKVTTSAVVPEGYTFTALASLESAMRVIDGRVKKRQGPATPSIAFGNKFLSEIKGCTVNPIDTVQAAFPSRS